MWIDIFSMPLKWSIKFDRDGDGEIRRLRDGNLRFAFLLHDPDTEKVVMETHGFRVDSNLTRILPPVTLNRNTVFSIVVMSPQWQQQLLDYMHKRSDHAQDSG